MTDTEFRHILETAPQNANIQKYLMVTRAKLRQHRRIAVSYSGGSDSDIIVDLIELVKPDDCGEIRCIFFDTGLEYDATHRHVAATAKKYGVNIEVRKAKVSIPAACRKHGVPFISKDISNTLSRLQRHNFDWSDKPENATPEKYGRCKAALDWYFDRRGNGESGKTRYSVERNYMLKEFIIANPPPIISDKCCDYAKKNVAYEFDKEFEPDLKIDGQRQAEGGRRAGSIKNCFSPSTDKKDHADYRPLWFWTDVDKAIYKEWRGITYSDCYEVWGFNRTGCVGCPCSSLAVQQLEIAKQYEPNKVKAAYAVFGKSYEYRERYNKFKTLGNQVTFDDMEE